MEHQIKLLEVQVNAKPDLVLEGILSLPNNARGIILFAHGSGSSRHSPRNQFVASILNRARLGTLLLDLLTPDEETIDNHTGQYRFDIDLLAARLEGAIDWLIRQNEMRSLNIGLFGASTGAGAALAAAAHRSSLVSAVVSRVGRPDLALTSLPDVLAPTLLIVGGNDTSVIELNQQAMSHLHVTKRLEIVPGASHLFEEPGTLEVVAELAHQWFTKYLARVGV